MIKKLFLTVSFVAIAIIGGGIYYIQTEYAGVGLPWVNSVKLPPLPTLPEPKTRLSEDDQGVLYFASKSPYSLQNALFHIDEAIDTTGMGTLYLPPNASADNPVPAMIILHGSGGLREDREFKYAQWFASEGIAAFVLDYYSVRGVTPDTKYMYKTLSASDIDIVTDAFSALKRLADHPAIDAQRIGVTGYSYGGMATRYTLDPRLQQALAPNYPPFALHISVYGPCFQTTGSEVTTGAPYMAIYGDQDNSVEPAFCEQLHQRLTAGGSTVSDVLIPGAGHAWENEMPRKEYDFPYVRGCEFSYTAEGIPTINGEVIPHPGPSASRDELAFSRVSVHLQAPQCLGNGYIIGRDEASDTISRQAMMGFMKQHFFQQ